MFCLQLPTADPRGAVAVALMSRLRSREDVRAAALLASLCFPPGLFRQQQQQKQVHALQQQQEQQQREGEEVALDDVAALLRPWVAPAAVRHAVQQQLLLPSLMNVADRLSGRQPIDLIVRDNFVSFGDLTLLLAPEAATPATVKQQEEEMHAAAQQQQQKGQLCGLLLHSQRLCVAAVAAALAAGFPVLLTGERGAGEGGP